MALLRSESVESSCRKMKKEGQVRTMRTALENSFRSYRDSPLFATLNNGEPTWLTFGDIANRIRPISAILHLLCSVEERLIPMSRRADCRPFVAIAGPNSLEWLVADWAAAGCIIPSVGLHPEWPPTKIKSALDLSSALIVVVTKISSLKEILSALAIPPTCTVKHVILLDPATCVASPNESYETLQQIKAEFHQLLQHVGLWSACSTPHDTPDMPITPESQAVAVTVPIAALVHLQAAVEAACAAGSHPASTASPPASPPSVSRAPSTAHPTVCSATDALFPVPSESFLQAACVVASTAPLFRPLATAAAVAATASKGVLASGHGAADWMAAAINGSLEARYDVLGIWSTLFATGSTGTIKATPISRAGWACSNGAWSSGKLPPGVGNSVVLSHSSLSHGLDRGGCWRAVLGGGRIAMVVQSHSHEAVCRALQVFRPATFVAMPSFWTRVYVDAVEEAAALLRTQLLSSAVHDDSYGPGCSSSPAIPIPATDSAMVLVSGLVTEQLRGVPQLLKATRQQVGARGLRRSPDGLLCHAWLARPEGSIAHALQAAGVRVRDCMSLPNNDVKMGSGGAPVSAEVLTFFNWIVFVSRFRDHYGATEAPGVAEGADVMDVNDGVLVRLAGDTGAAAAGTRVGELEVACPGGPLRYFGMDEGDASALAASQAAFTADGWWRSGDLVELTVKGARSSLRFLGRAADQVELYAAGDSVWLSASQLAATYGSSTVVHAGQLVVEGKRDDALLIAVMVPADAWVRAWLLQYRPALLVDGDTPLQALASPSAGATEARLLLAAEALAELRWYGGQMGLPALQLLSGVLIDPVPWSAAAGTLGAVAKPLRRAVLQLHQEATEVLFEQVKKATTGAADVSASPIPIQLLNPAPALSSTSPTQAAVTAALTALSSVSLQSQPPSMRVTMARVTAWQTLVAHVAEVRQAVQRQLVQPASPSAVPPLSPAVLPSSPASAMHSPWTGLLADLWAQVADTLKAPLGSVYQADEVATVNSTSVLSTPLFGLGCLVAKFSPEPAASCNLEELSRALSVSCLFSSSPGSSQGYAVQLVCVSVSERRGGTDVAGNLAPEHSIEYSAGHLVVAIVSTSSTCDADVSLTSLRRAAAAFGAPRAGWPVAIAHSHPAATPSDIQRSAQAAAEQFAAALAGAMMPWAARDPHIVYSWRVPPLPSAAEAAAVQEALDATRAAARRYWRCVDTDGNVVDRSVARALIKDDLDAAFDNAESVLASTSTQFLELVQSATQHGQLTNRDRLYGAAQVLTDCVQHHMPAAMHRIAEVMDIQSKLEQACLAEVPSIGAAAAQHIAAVTVLCAAAVRAGVPLPWQVKTLDFAPPKDSDVGLAAATAAAAAATTTTTTTAGTQVGDIVFSAIPPVEDALTGRPLWHAGLAREEDYPMAAVNMECGSSSNPATLSLPVYTAVSRLAVGVKTLKQAVARESQSCAADLQRCVDEMTAALHGLDPTIAAGGMFSLERNFHWKQAFPFGWDSENLVTDTPTPAAWVHTALRTWGPRPCLGVPVEHAVDCVLAHLPVGGEESPSTPASSEASCQNTFTVSHNFAWMTYGQLDPLVHNLARSLRGLPGVQRGDLLGICANNCIEWLVADWAAALAGLCCVGFHVTYTQEELADTAARVQPAVVVVAPALLPTWLELARRKLLPGLRALVVLERTAGLPGLLSTLDLQDLNLGDCVAHPESAASLSSPPTDKSALLASTPLATPSLLLLSFEYLCQPTCVFWSTSAAQAAASENPQSQTPGRPDQLFTLLFTSGSSGKPKGVMISAETWRRDIGDYPPACRSYAWPFVNPSFIPLSHSSDRIRCWDTLGRGGRVGFCFYGAENWIAHQTGKKNAALQENLLTESSNNVETLVLHLASLRPTSLALPPRVWNGMKWLWDASRCPDPLTASPQALQALKLLRACANLDQAFGQRVLVLASGGAAPNPAVMAWVLSQFPGRTYHESYGATECGAITENHLPMPAESGRGLQLRLSPQPGFPHPRFGEMVVKTPTMALGYWRDPAANAEAFGPDGFWRTGDLCEACPDGSFVIIERIGALVAVPWENGVQLVAPARIEAALLANVDRVATLPDGLCIEHICCVPLAAAGGALVAAVCVRGVAMSSTPSPAGPSSILHMAPATCDTSPPFQPRQDSETDSISAILQWLRDAALQAGLRPWELPVGVALVPRGLWAAREGGLLNIQHKIARKRVQALLATLVPANT